MMLFYSKSIIKDFYSISNYNQKNRLYDGFFGQMQPVIFNSNKSINRLNQCDFSVISCN